MMDYLVIKDEDLFLLTDSLGNIQPISSNGLYTQDTRCLDTYVLTFNGKALSLLNSTCEKNYISTVYLTNFESVNDGVTLHRDSIEVKREQIVRNGVFYERMTFNNYARIDVDSRISIAFGSRFSDIFEARGHKREKRGKDLEPVVGLGEVELGYIGLETIERKLSIRCEQATATFADRFDIDVILKPNEPFVIEIVAMPSVDSKSGIATRFSIALQELEADYEQWLSSCMKITSDNQSLNSIIKRGLIDLRTLLTDLGDGPFPVAGIPWFAVPFGRDSLIAALQLLPFQPQVAKGTLLTLARLQGEEINRVRAEEPGKILHEIRFGEMSNLGEVPFKRYYGSIDSTPLFLILCVEYYRLTNDRALIREILPNIKRAIRWLDEYADVDSDGFVEYHVENSKGLSVQSWKDSRDSMIHLDGKLGISPMAVSEVQGYVYQAKVGLSEVLTQFGEVSVAKRLKEEALQLKTQFNEKFWMEERKYFAIALDQEKSQIQTITSDPGHCLWSDIIAPDKVDPVVNELLGQGLFSGWGIRTMSCKEPVYSPISYHNGSVWAHDNSLILLGFSKQGKSDAVNRLAAALLEASHQFAYQRLPELFCGHESSIGSIVRYPVACNPQAWAAGTSLVIAQAILGAKVDVENKRITLSPTWPEFVSHFEITNMPVGDTHVSFSLDQIQGVTERLTNGYTIELENSVVEG